MQEPRGSLGLPLRKQPANLCRQRPWGRLLVTCLAAGGLGACAAWLCWGRGRGHQLPGSRGLGDLWGCCSTPHQACFRLTLPQNNVVFACLLAILQWLSGGFSEANW